MDKKYCTNCGSENNVDAEYCINCGNSLVTKTVVPTEAPKKKKKKGGLVALIVILLIAGLIVGGIFLYKKLTYFEDPFGDLSEIDSTINTKTVLGQLEEDLNSGKITKDEYIKQLAYSVKEPVLVSESYSGLDNDFNDMNYLFSKANEMANDLSTETVKYLYDIFMMNDVEWDVEEEVSTEENDSVYEYEVQRVVKSNAGHLNKLDHVKLSKNGNFLVYYTTDGRNAVSNSKAKKLADYLEDVVSYYKSEYGYDFKYEQVDSAPFAPIELLYKMTKPTAALLLKKNDIDTKYLDTAMPIYIIDIDSENTNIPAWYCETFQFGDQLMASVVDVFYDNMQVDTARATYAFPYVVVDSNSFKNFDNTKVLVGHEMFHHYQKYICGNGSYARCSSGLFTVETTADLSGLKASKNYNKKTALNGHAVWYIQGVTNSIDKIQTKKHGAASIGYPAFIFGYNYAEIVPNGNKIINESSKSTNALKYLKDNSSGKYDEAFISMAKKNLTLDYKYKSLIPYNDDGSPIYPKKQDNLMMNILRSYNVEYSAINYFYYDPWYVKDALDHTQIKFESSSNTSELYVVLFVKEKGKYKDVYTHNLSTPFVIDAKEFVYYDEIAFAVVNTSVSNQLGYVVNTGGNDKLTITADALGLKKATSNKDKNRKVDDSSVMCYQIEDDTEFKTVTQVKISFDENNEVNDMYARGSIVMKNYDPNDPTYKFAKGVVSGLVFVLKKQYKQQFGNVSFRTKDSGQVYSITAHVKSDYMTAIKNSLEKDVSTREDIIEGFRAEGFICE